MDKQFSEAFYMILFAEEREKSWTQHPRLRSFLRGVLSPHVSSPWHAALLTAGMGQHLPMVEGREVRGTR